MLGLAAATFASKWRVWLGHSKKCFWVLTGFRNPLRLRVSGDEKLSSGARKSLIFDNLVVTSEILGSFLFEEGAPKIASLRL